MLPTQWISPFYIADEILICQGIVHGSWWKIISCIEVTGVYEYTLMWIQVLVSLDDGKAVRSGLKGLGLEGYRAILILNKVWLNEKGLLGLGEGMFFSAATNRPSTAT